MRESCVEGRTEKICAIRKMGPVYYGNANLLLMSSCNFDGADMLTFVNQVTGSNS
jgi:hypothetical protein